MQTNGDSEQDMKNDTPNLTPPSVGGDPVFPSAAAAAPAVPWHVASGDIPPPPPPPPAFATWEQPSPLRPRRGRRALAGVLAATFVVCVAAGVEAGRLTASPSTSPSSSVALIPDQNGTGTGTGNGSGSTGGGAGSSGGTGAANSDPSGVAAVVTPGIVNINVTLSGNGAAAGTGMVITSGGEVLTNNHVIDGETSMTVELPSTGKTYSAHVVGYDLTQDVALVQIDGGGNFKTVTIGNSSTVTIGQAVTALGNALGRNGAPAVSSGNVTALDRTITASDQTGADAETVSGLIQVTAPIQPGDSGGPLVTSTGAVIGMDTAAQSGGGRFDQTTSTIAYAIPINTAMSIVKQIQSGTGTSLVHIGDTRALLGVGAQDTANGVQVAAVQGGSAAANAGITVGSFITALNGTSISTNSALRNAIVTHQPGQTVSVTWTDPAGQSHTANVTLSSGPPA